MGGLSSCLCWPCLLCVKKTDRLLPASIALDRGGTKSAGLVLVDADGQSEDGDPSSSAPQTPTLTSTPTSTPALSKTMSKTKPRARAASRAGGPGGSGSGAQRHVAVVAPVVNCSITLALDNKTVPPGDLQAQTFATLLTQALNETERFEAMQCSDGAPAPQRPTGALEPLPQRLTDGILHAWLGEHKSDRRGFLLLDVGSFKPGQWSDDAANESALVVLDGYTMTMTAHPIPQRLVQNMTRADATHSVVVQPGEAHPRQGSPGADLVVRLLVHPSLLDDAQLEALATLLANQLAVLLG